MFAGNFAPRGWAVCDGELLPIAHHTALFSIIGTYYGGDGRSTFALPDLRGRVPIHAGKGPGLTERKLGEMGGAETIKQEAHKRAERANNPEKGIDTSDLMKPNDNMQPFLSVNFIIALEGRFPARN